MLVAVWLPAVRRRGMGVREGVRWVSGKGKMVPVVFTTRWDETRGSDSVVLVTTLMVKLRR